MTPAEMRASGDRDRDPSSDESREKQEAFDVSRGDRDRTLAALHRLESALAMASGTNEWVEAVIGDLRSLESAMRAERDELNRPDSLLAMIAAEAPRRFGPRIRGIRDQYDDITRQVGSLLRETGPSQRGTVDSSDLRHRCGSVIRAVHHCRARQTDLVYEALRLDLGER